MGLSVYYLEIDTNETNYFNFSFTVKKKKQKKQKLIKISRFLFMARVIIKQKYIKKAKIFRKT